MRPSRIFETVLYTEDLAAAERFYRDAVGLEVIGRGDLAVVFRCGGSVLLIFRSSQEWHIGERCSFAWDFRRRACRIRCQARGAFDAWREQLRNGGISIEREVDWDEGGRSLIFVTRRAILSNWLLQPFGVAVGSFD